MANSVDPDQTAPQGSLFAKTCLSKKNLGQLQHFPSIFRYGEPFEIGKHPQGTEVKAITYSNMQIYDTDDKHEVFVIIDI